MQMTSCPGMKASNNSLLECCDLAFVGGELTCYEERLQKALNKLLELLDTTDHRKTSPCGIFNLTEVS